MQKWNLAPCIKELGGRFSGYLLSWLYLIRADVLSSVVRLTYLQESECITNCGHIAGWISPRLFRASFSAFHCEKQNWLILCDPPGTKTFIFKFHVNKAPIYISRLLGLLHLDLSCLAACTFMGPTASQRTVILNSHAHNTVSLSLAD